MIEFAIVIAIYITCVIAEHTDRRTMRQDHGASGRTGNRPLVARSHARRMR